MKIARQNIRLYFSIIAIVVSNAVIADDVERKPNVVILFTDDQGTLDANCYGSDDLETPNLDRLAASGIRFTQAYAHTVWAVRKGDWKLICDKRENLSLRQLTDPQPEVKDYASEYPEIVAELTQLHHNWAQDVNSQ